MRDESDTTQRTCVNVNMLSYPTKNIRNVTKIMECQSVCQKCERYSENANVLAFHKATDNTWQVWRIWIACLRLSWVGHNHSVNTTFSKLSKEISKSSLHPFTSQLKPPSLPLFNNSYAQTDRQTTWPGEQRRGKRAVSLGQQQQQQLQQSWVSSQGDQMFIIS